MEPKTILACLTTPEQAETLLKFAVPLARKHTAHLIGLHTIEGMLVYPGVGMYVPGSAFVDFNTSQQEASELIKAVFTRHTTNEDFASEFRLVRSEAVSANERMVESARAADLVVMAHEDTQGDRYDTRQSHQHVIRNSGRPVIVVPLGYDGPEIGSNVMLGWSDTREATRAAHDMLAIVQPGAAITVLRVGNDHQGSLGDSNGIELTEMLARHDLTPTLEHRQPMGDGIADVLNKAAFEKGADLIVTGAFGHSATYDFVIGATSHALLKTAKLPVLFSK